MRLAATTLLLAALTQAAHSDDRYGPIPAAPLPIEQAASQAGQGDRRVTPLASSFDVGAPSVVANTAPSLPSPGLPSTAAPRFHLPAQPSAARQPAHRPPAASARTTPSNRPATATALAFDPVTLMRGMMRAPSDSQLSGQPVGLEQVVSNARTRTAQTHRINAYWTLCSTTADYYLGLAEAKELAVEAKRTGGASAAINRALDQWRTRNRTSHLAAVAAQRRLAHLMGSAAAPLPGDLPLCGAYNTRYSQVFAGRSSEEARNLDQLIPLRFAELKTASARVAQTRQFASKVKDRDQTGEGMLMALELLALNRRAFVQIAKDYNRQISRYTELSTPGNIATPRLVAMLVERPKNSATASQSRPSNFRPEWQ